MRRKSKIPSSSFLFPFIFVRIKRERYKKKMKESCLCFRVYLFRKNCIKMRKTHDRRRRPIFCVNFSFPSPPPFFLQIAFEQIFIKNIYIYVSVYAFTSWPILSYFSSTASIAHPTLRVLRTDIRTIKELLMVRIWSRQVVVVRRRNQPYIDILSPSLKFVVDDRAGFFC